jgi:hypothetical protein
MSRMNLTHEFDSQKRYRENGKLFITQSHHHHWQQQINRSKLPASQSHQVRERDGQGFQDLLKHKKIAGSQVAR